MQQQRSPGPMPNYPSPGQNVIPAGHNQTGTVQGQVISPTEVFIPRELCKSVLPIYRIEPPDVLMIDAVHVVPRPPYHLRALDLLYITVQGTLPDAPIKPLEGLFRAKVIKLLVEEKLLPVERVQVLYSWKHSGFNLHAGEQVPPEAKADLEDLAQYILRNPFSVEKMTIESPGDIVIYRSRLNAKIKRNFEVFTPTDFLAAITQHIPDKGAQMVRYYGWYSNKKRGLHKKTGITANSSQAEFALPNLRQISLSRL